MRYFWRRLVGIVIDWALCLLIATGLLHVQLGRGGAGSLVPLAVLFVEHTLLVGTLGTTIGHRVVGLVVRAEDGRPAGPTRALVRTLLLCLVIPAVVWDASGRGMHDRWARTDILRLDQLTPR